MPPMPNSRKNADRHKQKTVSFRLPETLMDAFRDLANRNRRTLSGEVRIAIENHLAASGVRIDDRSVSLPGGDGRRRLRPED
jgi:hypothetical protein